MAAHQRRRVENGACRLGLRQYKSLQEHFSGPCADSGARSGMFGAVLVVMDVLERSIELRSRAALLQLHSKLPARPESEGRMADVATLISWNDRS